ncbi:hypothetical protein F511_13483 [Dorcoceras hygrometricum]|uniref:Dystroglycan-like n=1 Tax=Dorcoceras hygrometricum TaxID=472368 RepID=A0A2Z7AA12_9LAMI|nr:hypothetical protein F511_13483 [Dorcoceras hygrometricum]
MASSFYSNSQHVDCDSVLAMDDQGMVSMFQGLMASGLAGFLGCPAVIYEAALVDFFENASVREGVIISTVAGQLVEISEEWFAESFELPLDGLGDLSEIPKDVIFDARSIVSLSGEPVSLSGRKNQMKIEFRLLCDIMAKAISVKAGTFKKMVTPGSKQAKGFAVQISLLLENIPNLELGESSEFPASKILTDKTVHRFVSLNDKAGAEEANGAPKPKAASKKRRVVDVGAAVAKKKRTIKKKYVTSHSTLEMVAVAQEIVPLQMVEPCPDVPAVEEHVEQPAAEEGISADQPVEVGVGEVAAEIDASADRDKPADTNEERGGSGSPTRTWFLKNLPKIPAENKGKAILVEKDPMKGNPAQEHYFLICADIDLLVALRAKVIDEVAQFFNSFSLKKLATINIEEMYKKEEQVLSWGETESPQLAIQRKLYILLKYRELSLDQRESSPTSADSSSSLHSDTTDLDATASSLPSVSIDFSAALADFQVILSEQINEYQSGISSILHKIEHGLRDSLHEQAKVFKNLFQEARHEGRTIDDVQTLRFNEFRKNILAQNASIFTGLADVRKEVQEVNAKVHKIEHGLRDSLHEQAKVFKNLFQEARHEGRTIDDVQTLRFNEFRKNILAQNASIFTGLADVRKEVQEVNAKVDIMASRLNDVRQNVEETKEALSHQLLEFQSQAQANQNILHAQLSELVDYINRGSADKKGESSSRGPQQPPNVQIRDSGTGGDSTVRTPTFAQRVEMVQRQIVENVLDADRNNESLERQAATERLQNDTVRVSWNDVVGVYIYISAVEPVRAGNNFPASDGGGGGGRRTAAPACRA